MSALQPVESARLRPAEMDARFRRPLMSYFLRRIDDRAEAEDLTQQTFLRLLGAARDEVANPAAFVFRVAANLLRDRFRNRREGICGLEDDGVAASLADMITPERIVLARDGVGAVLRALEELGDTTRDVFILFRFENMRQRDIALRLGISQAAVEKQVMRATLHLLRVRGSD